MIFIFQKKNFFFNNTYRYIHTYIVSRAQISVKISFSYMYSYKIPKSIVWLCYWCVLKRNSFILCDFPEKITMGIFGSSNEWLALFRSYPSNIYRVYPWREYKNLQSLPKKYKNVEKNIGIFWSSSPLSSQFECTPKNGIGFCASFPLFLLMIPNILLLHHKKQGYYNKRDVKRSRIMGSVIHNELLMYEKSSITVNWG